MPVCCSNVYSVNCIQYNRGSGSRTKDKEAALEDPSGPDGGPSAVDCQNESSERSSLTTQSSGDSSVPPSAPDITAGTPLLPGQSPRPSERAVTPGYDAG